MNFCTWHSKTCLLCLQIFANQFCFTNSNPAIQNNWIQNFFEKKIILKEYCQKSLRKKQTSNIFVTNFLFLTDSLRGGLYCQNSLSITKVFLSMLPNCCMQIYKWVIPEKIQQGGCRHGSFRGIEKIECGNSRG